MNPKLFTGLMASLILKKRTEKRTQSKVPKDWPARHAVSYAYGNPAMSILSMAQEQEQMEQMARMNSSPTETSPTAQRSSISVEDHENLKQELESLKAELRQMQKDMASFVRKQNLPQKIRSYTKKHPSLIVDALQVQGFELVKKMPDKQADSKTQKSK